MATLTTHQFFQANGNIEYFTPRPYQMQLMERYDDYCNNAVLAHRQCGKSLVSLFHSLHNAELGESTLILTHNIQLAGWYNTRIIPDTNKCEQYGYGYQFNNSVVNAKSIGQIINIVDIEDELYKYDNIIIDEAAYCAETSFGEVMNVIDRMTLPPNLTLITTPSKHHGKAHEIYTDDNFFKKTFIRPMVTKLLDKVKTEEMLKHMGKEVFRREYLLKW